MNEEDKKRFARYRPGFKEPDSDDEKTNKEKASKNKIGFVENIDIDQENLINNVLKEFENRNK